MITVTISDTDLKRFDNEVHKSMRILNKLRDAGVPVVGTLSVLYAERGVLSSRYDSLMGYVTFTWSEA